MPPLLEQPVSKWVRNALGTPHDLGDRAVRERCEDLQRNLRRGEDVLDGVGRADGPCRPSRALVNVAGCQDAVDLVFAEVFDVEAGDGQMRGRVGRGTPCALISRSFGWVVRRPPRPAPIPAGAWAANAVAWLRSPRSEIGTCAR